jgi:hypothetical protein
LTTTAAALLIVLMAILAGGAARHESPTIDEIAHIGAGVSYLQRFDLRLNGEHPPLAKALAAIPLVVRGAHADYSSPSWTLSHNLFTEFLGEWVFGHWFLIRWNDAYATLLWARVPMLLLTLLLGVAIYALGKRLGGHWAGLLCLAAYASMPAFIAFGPLVITDVLVALFWLLTVWQFPEMWRSPSRSKIVKLGLTLAGAFLTKFSSGLLFFVFVALALSLRWLAVPEQPEDKTLLRAWRRRAWLNMGKATLWSAGFVYVFYLIFSWNEPTDSFSVIPQFPASPLLRRLLMPVWKYLVGLASFAVSALSRPTYILGHSYPHGVWFYFPALFVLKSPLAFLLLLVLAATVAVILRATSNLPPSAIALGMVLHWRALWVSLLVFVGVCMMNRLDLSIRHFTIALVLVILFLAPLPNMLDSLRRLNWGPAGAARCLTIGLAVACVVTAVWVYPYYFPFKNSLSRGRPGYLLMNDSNLDWNQALPEIEKFVQQRGIDHVLLDEYGFMEPEAYVPQAELWSCQDPSAQNGGRWAVVSASNIVDGHNCLWLMHYPHQALAGGGMYALQLPQTIPPPGTPNGPPLPADFRYIGGFPMFEPRLIFLECIRHPDQLQAIRDRFVAQYRAGASQHK